MNKIIDYINYKISDIFDPDISNLKPVIFDISGNTGVTICPENKDAFTLNPPMAGICKSYESDKKQLPDAAIVRAVVEYTLMDKMYNNPKLIPFHISMILNMCLLQIYKELGLNEYNKRKITFGRPGREHNFFSELDSYAGYEFRVYAFKENDENSEL